MRKRTLAELLGIVLLSGLLLPPATLMPPASHAYAAGCQSPLAPGHYTGSFGYLLEVVHEESGLTVDTTIHYGADADLDIACDGQITGKIYTKAGSAGDTTSDLVQGAWEYDTTGVLDESATCDLFSKWEIESGKVSVGAGGKPKIDWLFKTSLWDPSAIEKHPCTGDEDLVNLLHGILYDNPLASPKDDQRNVTWQAVRATSTSASSDVPWDDPLAAEILSKLQKNGATKQEANWSISMAEPPPPTATPQKQKKAPIISNVHGQLQEYFLEHTPSVTNRYSADLDWQGEEPGPVTFRLDNNAPVLGQVSGNEASAEIAIDNLSAGQNHTLTVTAASSGGTSQSAPFPVNVIAVPPWAQPYKLQAQQAEEGASSVIYQNTANKNFPSEPLQALLTIPDLVPFIGGTWGMNATQFQTGLSVSSLGTNSNTSITGSGGFSVAGKDIPVEVNDKTSVTRTRIGNNKLQFVTDVQPGDIAQAATINFKLPDQTLFSKKLSLIEVFPGLSSLLDSGKVGKFIKQFDLTLFQASISAELSGKGRLGIQDDHVALTGGSATMGLNVAADASPSLFGLASGGIQGNLHGTATFDLSLPPHFTDCSLDGAIFFKYSVIGFGSGTYPSDPTAMQLASCEAFGSSRRGPFLMAPATDSLSPPRLTPRSSTWKPESIVTPPAQSSEGSVTSSTLVENANAELSSPAIASAPGGRMAVAWVSEAADRPRPRAWRVALRLFDGKTWGTPIMLGDGANPSYSPSVAFDKSGQVIVAWVQGDGSVLGSSPELSDEMLRSLDVAYAAVDASGSIKKSGTMSGDRTMDFSPQLASGQDGSLWLAWESSRDLWFIAPDSSPNTLWAAPWDGSGWQSPEQVSTGVSGVTSWHLATRDAQTAMVVAVRAGQDGVPGEIVAYERTRSGWQGKQRLAGNLGRAVAAFDAYNASGKPVVVWSTGQEINGLLGDLKAAPMPLLQTDRTLTGFAGGGDVTTLILASAAEDRTGLWAAYLDPSTGKVGQQTSLLSGGEPVISVDSAAAANGDLLAIVSVPVRKTEPLPGGRAGTETLQQPELTSIELVRLASGAGAAASQVPRGGALFPINPSLLAPTGGALAALFALAGVLVLARRRRAGANLDGIASMRHSSAVPALVLFVLAALLGAASLGAFLLGEVSGVAPGPSVTPSSVAAAMVTATAWPATAQPPTADPSATSPVAQVGDHQATATNPTRSSPSPSTVALYGADTATSTEQMPTSTGTRSAFTDPTSIMQGSATPTALATSVSGSAIQEDNAAQVVLLKTIAMGAPVNRIAFNADTQDLVAAGTADKKVNVWTRPGTTPVVRADPEKTVTSLSFTPDGRTLAASSMDGQIYIWSIDGIEGRPQYINLGYFSGTGVEIAAISPDGTLLADRPQHDPMELTAVRGGQHIVNLADLPADPRQMAFSPDGTKLAVSDWSGMLGIYSVPDGKLLNSWQAGVKPLMAFAWSPDGGRIATTASNHDLHIWSVDGAPLVTLKPELDDRPDTVAWSPDGGVLAIGTTKTPDSAPATKLPGGGYYSDIALVSSSDGHQLQTLHGHTEEIIDLVFSHDGRYLASSSGDGTLRLWGLP